MQIGFFLTMQLAGQMLSGETRFTAIHNSIQAAAVNPVRQPDFSQQIDPSAIS